MPKSKEEVKQIERNETRQFRYSADESDVSFEFEIDVSSPETALAEIADFKEQMTSAINDLDELAKEFAGKVVEKPEEEDEDEGPVEVIDEKPQPTATS